MTDTDHVGQTISPAPVASATVDHISGSMPNPAPESVAKLADTPPARTEAEQADLDAKRAEAAQKVDEIAQARAIRSDDISGVAAVTRDRTLAVQEEVATRERDGVVAGTPAFARRQDRIREIVGQTEDGEELSEADRIRSIASRMHTASPSGIEELQHELMALAEEMAPLERKPVEPAPAPVVTPTAREVAA